MSYTKVPYVIAYANELVEDPISFEWYAGKQRLAYLQPRPSDWVQPPAPWRAGTSRILRARVRDLRDKPARRGSERMRKLNARRQWRCMDRLLCQVCGGPATDPESGRIPWLVTSTVFEATGEDSGRTNTPPCCWNCIPKAMEECAFRDDFTLYTVASTTSAGVLADVYAPGVAGSGFLTKHNAFVSWGWPEFHPRALAVAQVIELHGMKLLTP